MIIEAILNAVVGLLEVIFAWINLPQMPVSLTTALDTFEDLAFSSATCLGFFVRLSTVKILIPLVIVVVNFDKVYHFTMWLIRKLPFGIE